MWEYRCPLVFSFSLDEYLEVELLDHVMILFWFFWGTSILFSIVAITVNIPTSSIGRVHFLHILTNIYFMSFLITAIQNSCEVVSHCGFDLHFLMVNYSEHLFIYLLAICIYYLKKCLFRSSAHFLKSGFFFFLLLSYMSSLYILNVLAPFKMYDLQIFSSIH